MEGTLSGTAPAGRPGSAPVRILRDETTRETPGLAGIYPVADGAGYAGGIVSAVVNTLRLAKAVMARYSPMVEK